MILTITPSPAIDWTIRIGRFELGAVNRATSTSREASGKGVNVSWALHRAGRATHAVFPAGGSSAVFMAEQLTSAGMDCTVTPNKAEVRTNISLVSDGDSGTKINEEGAPLDAESLDALLDALSDRVATSTLVVSCGSLPPGAPTDLHGRIVERCTANGVEAIVDTSGDALHAAIGYAPALIKPNVHELAALVDRELYALGDVVHAARTSIARGTRAVLVSLGGDGALYVDSRRAVHAKASTAHVVNTVGAGDALLAGFLSTDGDITERLRTAVLWASSAVSCPTTLFPVQESLLGRIVVREIDDFTRPLHEPGFPCPA